MKPSKAQLDQQRSIAFPIDNLLECKWAGIGFPISNLNTQISHDVVEHKFPYVDGGKLEQMGRNSTIISATCVFINTIAPARSESWIQGDLYPRTYGKFIEACSDGRTAKLQHPFLGEFDAKVISCNSAMSPNNRGGEIVNVTWKSTITNTPDLAVLTNIPVSGLPKLGVSLDTGITTLSPLFPGIKQGFSFSALTSELTSIIGRGTLYAQRALAVLGHIVYAANRLINACILANNALLASIAQMAYSMWSTAINLTDYIHHPAQAGAGIIGLTPKANREQAIYVAKAPITFSSLADVLSNSVTDLMQLNPRLLGKAVISKDAKVNYYK